MIFSRQLPVVPVIVFVLTPIMAGIEAHAGRIPAWPSDSTSLIAATQGPGLEAWVQLLGMLLLLLGIFAAAAWGIKRWRLLPQLREGGHYLKVLETRSLGQRNSLLVVQYQSRKFLVGSGSNGVHLIGDLSNESSLDQDQSRDDASSGGVGEDLGERPGFFSELSQHIQKEDK